MAAWDLDGAQWDALDELRFSTNEADVFRNATVILMTGVGRSKFDMAKDLGCSPATVEIYWLPPYSPSLNLIERLWGHLKRTVLANVLYRNLDDLVTAFRKGVTRITGNRGHLGFMFDHDDLTQEIQATAHQRAA